MDNNDNDGVSSAFGDDDNNSMNEESGSQLMMMQTQEDILSSNNNNNAAVATTAVDGSTNENNNDDQGVYDHENEYIELNEENEYMSCIDIDDELINIDSENNSDENIYENIEEENEDNRDRDIINKKEFIQFRNWKGQLETAEVINRNLKSVNISRIYKSDDEIHRWLDKIKTRDIVNNFYSNKEINNENFKEVEEIEEESSVGENKNNSIDINEHIEGIDDRSDEEGEDENEKIN